ncbi:hypothetical protein B0H10DRAFT_2346101 [Mycena sp. CBHHK59/15]|nr:hypothetical protein B0H10DRAFT_2346101 [Mycena sp. CBHHK59/15]
MSHLDSNDPVDGKKRYVCPDCDKHSQPVAIWADILESTLVKRITNVLTLAVKKGVRDRITFKHISASTSSPYPSTSPLPSPAPDRSGPPDDALPAHHAPPTDPGPFPHAGGYASGPPDLRSAPLRMPLGDDALERFDSSMLLQNAPPLQRRRYMHRPQSAASYNEPGESAAPYPCHGHQQQLSTQQYPPNPTSPRPTTSSRSPTPSDFLQLPPY